MKLMRCPRQNSISVIPAKIIPDVEIQDRSDKGLLGPGAVGFIKIAEGQTVSLIFRIFTCLQTSYRRGGFLRETKNPIHPDPRSYAFRSTELYLPILAQLDQVDSHAISLNVVNAITEAVG